MRNITLVRGIVVSVAAISGTAVAHQAVVPFMFTDAQVKQADTFFDSWANPSSQFYHQEFSDVALAMPGRFQSYAQKKVAENPVQLAPFNTFFSLLAQKYWMTDAGAMVFNKQFRNSIKKVYSMLDRDVPSFLKMLKKYGLATEVVNGVEAKRSFLKVIDKYNAFADMFCVGPSEDVEDALRFALANRFFEFCYAPETWPQFKTMLTTSSEHPLIRLLHSVVWYNLAGDGWKNWHMSTLNALKREYDQGKEVVYVAGGCDIYNLLKHGVYRIRVIDPMLPTQPRYYIPEWEWFMRAENPGMGIGDTLNFNFNNKKLTMKRTDYKEGTGVMSVKDLQGNPRDIKESVTTWTLYDAHDQVCGSVIFDRRYACQNDFNASGSKALLMSFNELYYVITVGDDNWGIDLKAIPDQTNMYIKQLRKPVDKVVMANMRSTDASDFQFIKLGTAVCEP